MRTLMLGLLCAGAVLCPTAAHADQADVHFKKGVALAKAGSIAEAEAELEQAWALRQAWDIAGNLGLTEAAQGKWEEAAGHMHYALKFIGSLATDEQRKGLEERYANVRDRLSLVNVNPNVEVAVTIKIGARTQSSGAPVFLSEGTHKLECAAEGYESVVVEVTAVKGETQNLKVELKKIGGGPGPGPVVPPDERAVWPAVLLGVSGGAFLAAGLGSLIGGLVVKSGVDDGTGSGTCETDASCADLQSELEDAKLLGTLGVVGLSVGVVALGGMGLYLALTPDSKPHADKVGLRLSPNALVLEGSF